MMIVPVVITFTLGLLILRLLSRSGADSNIVLDLFWAYGIGVGIMSQLTLLCVLALGGCVPSVIRIISLLLLVCLMIYYLRRRNTNFFGSWHAPMALLLVCMFMLLLCVLAVQLPYGGYDAWSLWNYRAASVFRSGVGWMAVFHNQVQGQHPWLLPFYNVWSWSWLGQESVGGPISTAVLMGTATMGLVVLSIEKEIGRVRALLGGLLLASIPFFTWHAVSQYASIFVAYYTLAVAVAFLNYEKSGESKWVVLSAFFLGFLFSSKDEGVVLGCLFLLSSFCTGYGARALRTRVFWFVLMLSLSGMFVTEVLMRTSILHYPFVTSLNQHIDFSQVIDLERWQLLGAYVWNRIFHHPEFGRMWLWVPVILLGLSLRFVRFIVLLVGGYLTLFFVLYVIARDPILWRLGVSLNRVVFHVIPLLVLAAMISFPSLSRKE